MRNFKIIFSIYIFIFLSLGFLTTSINQVKADNTFTFNYDLKIGMTHPEVKELQNFLNTNSFPVASSGAGSPGKETTTFGTKTKKAVILFQKANKITPNGLFGPMTRRVVNSKYTKVVEVKPDIVNTVAPLGYIYTSNGLVKIRSGGSTHRTVTYNLTYTAGANGSIVGTTSQTVNSGASGTTVTAIPDTGYHFTSWSDGVTTSSRTDANVTENISATASIK